MGKSTITLGKLRALQRTSTPGNVFTILALDHRDSLRRLLRPEAPRSLSDLDMVSFKLDVINALRDDLSAVLLDPLYGAAQAILAGIMNHVGLLVELEKADDDTPTESSDIVIDSDWSVNKIKRMGADAVKLFFHYNLRDTMFALSQEQTIRYMVRECAMQDIPLFAKPIIHPRNEVESTAHAYEGVISTAQRIGALGVDVLMIEFPSHTHTHFDESACAEACHEITESLDIPWVLLSAGVDFETFCQEVEIACKGGASGFIAGRAIWGDACSISNRDERRHWLDHDGRPRMKTVQDIASQYATPWTQRFRTPLLTTSWFRSY